jgi:ADP-ribosylglycohydrolase
MAWLDISEYRRKVEGCWMGKNIGGTLGAPFEGARGAIEISFYAQDLKGEPAPNDDLDLQLVWLKAAEQYGRAVNASILGEFWLTYIHPNWNEYGFGKNNMRMGITPPLSGSVSNPHKDSNGAWIRSEIWACLAPGHPDIAARYAFEDASVDHSGDGVYAAVFCAALQSAAFVEHDMFALIDIALSYVPAECGVVSAVRNVIRSKQGGLDWKAARRSLLKAVPDSFFSRTTGEPEPDLPRGELGYDAPANIGLFILGWLYGDDDFGKSLCVAVGCGEDTDCTGATLGATLGIIHGIDGIPEKWIAPIGNSIKTFCLTEPFPFAREFPASIDELTDHILKLAPRFLDLEDVDLLSTDHGYRLKLLEGDALRSVGPDLSDPHGAARYFDSYLQNKHNRPFAVRYETPLYYAWLDYGAEPYVVDGQPLELKLHLHNRQRNFPLWLTLHWSLPEGWAVSPSRESWLFLSHQAFTGQADATFTLTPSAVKQARHDLYLDIRIQGRHSRLVIPVTLFAMAS